MKLLPQSSIYTLNHAGMSFFFSRNPGQLCCLYIDLVPETVRSLVNDSSNFSSVTRLAKAYKRSAFHLHTDHDVT